MDIKTKIQVIVSLVLVTLIGLLTYWIQLPAGDLKAQLLTENPTVLVRIKDFGFTPDVVRIEKGTTVSWLNDETDANAGVQHTVSSYDPKDSTKSGELFKSDLLSQGDTFTYNFTEDGVYNYDCTLHPFMTGKVCVGAASETEDTDCAVDATQPEETLGGDEGTLTEETTTTTEDTTTETTLPEEETTTTTTTTEETLPQEEEVTLPPLEEAEVSTTTNLQSAADEDYVPETSTQTAPTYTSDQQYTKTANSGPEDYIYIMVGLIALLGAKKFIKKAES